MSESEQTTKTVVVDNDVHKAIRHLSDDEDMSIQDTVDKVLREHDSVQEWVDLLEKRDSI